MLKKKPTCAVCKAIKDDGRLLQDIYNTKHYLKTKGLSLLQFHELHKDQFSYKSLRNHVLKHQFISEDDYTKRHLNRIAKESEQKIVRRAVESREVFDEVIGKGMEELQKGNLEVTTTHLLSAAKMKKEFQLKEQDQQIAMMEMVYHFASGENKESQAYDRRIIEGQAVEDYDPTAELTDDSERRTAQSRDFYESLAGDTPSSRTN